MSAVKVFESAESARAFIVGTKLEGACFELGIADGFTFAGLPDTIGAGMAFVVHAILAQGYQPDGFDQRKGFRLYRYVPVDD